LKIGSFRTFYETITIAKLRKIILEKLRIKIGKALAETSKRHGNTFAEPHQSGEKEYRADDDNSHKVWPYRAEAGAAVKDRLGEADEVGGRRRLHDDLHDLRHALVRCAAAGEHLQG
jgi:hypothetical protein